MTNTQKYEMREKIRKDTKVVFISFFLILGIVYEGKCDTIFY